jgi:undecaprenyl-diphosphatase
MPVRPRRPPRRAGRLLVVAVVLAVGLAAPAVASAAGRAAPAPEPAPPGMGAFEAVVLGLVEGVTEYLPVSSTGHLTVVQDLLGVGTGSPREKEAADAYAVVIQAGAILAVVVLYWRRLLSLVEGLLGRDEAGRRVLVGTAVAVLPVAVVGLALESRIKERLFGTGPVIVAWVVGGVVLLVLSRRGWWAGDRGDDTAGEVPAGAGSAEAAPAAVHGPAAGLVTRRRGARPLEAITARQAAIIGVAQILALWPGTSRSLVTIVAGLAVGLSLAAAVEFSFLVGLVTLGAATLVDAAKHGRVIVDVFGWVDPVLGFVVAFAAAVVAVRWMVTYLQRHDLAVFGWYRLGVAAFAGVLLWRGVL